MNGNMMPFNIELLMLEDSYIAMLKEVKSLDIFENNTKEFKDDGLFSKTIFGELASEERNLNFGYIDLKVPVFHPLIFIYITALKSLYGNIILGKQYATFDKDSKDFVLSNSENGETGFEFFIKHFDKIELKDNDSDARRYKIDLIKKYKLKDLLVTNYLVIPAGLREYVIDKNGKPTEDEVNTLYRNLLKTTNLLTSNLKEEELYLVNTTRARVQTVLVEIYEHYEALLKGKKKFLQNKWSKRAIANSTRNVATILPIEDINLNKDKYPGFNDSVIGLYQYCKAILPIFSFNIKDRFLNRIFGSTATSTLVNVNTLKTEYATIDLNIRDSWLSDEGINSIVNKLSQEELRSEPVFITPDYYLMLIYDDGKKIFLIEDSENIPEEYNVSKYIRPITYAELLYLSIYDIVNRYPAFVVRYPVSNLGSNYPCNIYLKTTVHGREIELVNIDGSKLKINEFPILTEAYFNSIAVHSTHMERMKLDFDGDTLGITVVYSKESLNEIRDMLRSKDFYITYDNKVTYSAESAVLKNLTNTINKYNN